MIAATIEPHTNSVYGATTVVAVDVFMPNFIYVGIRNLHSPFWE